jgi:hypothetical protein
MLEAAYLGRFQPFCNHHTQRVREFLSERPEINLYIGIADYQGPKTKTNFLNASEAKYIAEISLADAGLKATVKTVEINPDGPLESQPITPLLLAFNLIVSGSPNTIKAAINIARFYHHQLEIITLPQDFKSPHASDFRRSLINGDQTWKQMVSPSVVTYLLAHSEIITRLLSLPDNLT